MDNDSKMNKLKIVIGALENHIPIKMPDDAIVVIIDGKLCMQMDHQKMVDGAWKYSTAYFNYEITYNQLVDLVNKFDEGEIINLVWLSSQAADRLDDKRKELSEKEFKTFFFDVALDKE